jgi:hypothetical protein
MNLPDAYYEMKFENEFLREKGGAFQTDFMACRPWGQTGDRKNDGYLKSERCLFQVYAPNEMKASEAKAKITEDFVGAKQYWRQYFDSWVFVHNATGGLPPHVQQLLLDLAADNPDIDLTPWCLEELRVIFRRLSDSDKASWLGLAGENRHSSAADDHGRKRRSSGQARGERTLRGCNDTTEGGYEQDPIGCGLSVSMV